MKTNLFAVLAVVLAGCGVTDATLDELGNDTNEDSAELSTRSQTYVVMRRDLRRCVSPMCGGYYVRDVNRVNLREVYVSGLDFSQSGLLEETIADVTSAADFEVVLRGKLGAEEPRFQTRPFIVTAAWRGMPGVKVADGATFFSVASVSLQCIAAPCPTLKATKLNSTSATLAHDVDVAHAAKPLVDRDWLTDRVVNKGALVAGAIVDGAKVGVSREKVVDAAQVFVKLPDVTQSCPRFVPAQCPAGRVPAFQRNVNRCITPAGCVVPGACAAFVPSCADGYSLVSWQGGLHACQQYACDPGFLLD